MSSADSSSGTLVSINVLYLIFKLLQLDLCTTHGSRRRVNSVEKMSNDEFDEDDVSDVINGIVEAGDGELAASLLTPASDDVPSLIQAEIYLRSR